MKSYDEGYRSVKEKYQKRLSEKGEQQHENFKIVINNSFDRRRFASITTVAVVFVLLVAVVLPISLMNGFGDFFNPGGNFASSDSSETSIDLQNGYPIQSGIWGIEYKCGNLGFIDTLKLRPHSVTITSYEELQINFGYLQVYSDMGVKQLFDALSIYDQNFFRDQALVFLTVFEPSSTTKRDVEVAEKVYSQERTNETTIFLIDKSPSEMKNDEEAIWSYLIPIPAENALNEKYIKIIDKEEDYNKQPVLIRDSGVLKTELTYLSDKIIVEEKATPDDLRSFSFSAELYCIYGNYKNPSGMMLSYAEIIDQNGNVIMHSQDQIPEYNRLFGPIEQGKTETWGYYFSESVVQRKYSMPVFPAGTYDIRIVAPGTKDLYIEDAIIIKGSNVFKTELTYLDEKIIVEEKTSQEEKRSFKVRVNLKYTEGTYSYYGSSTKRQPYVEIIDKDGNVILNNSVQLMTADYGLRTFTAGDEFNFGIYFGESGIKSSETMPEFPAGTYDIRITNPGAEELYIKDAIIIKDDVVVDDNFAIHFETWIIGERKNVFDTFDGYIQKDLVTKGIAKKDYTITKAELDEIYRNIYQIKDIKQEMTSDNLSKDNNRVAVSPMTYYVITFSADGMTYTIKGDYTSFHYKDSSPEAEAFCKAVDFLNNFMHSTDVYKSMPKAEGGYD